MKNRLVLDPDDYAVRGLERLRAPGLLVFRTAVERNVETMRNQLQALAPGSGFDHLCPHVKTHKSRWVTELLQEHGVQRFKCSLNELDMLIEAGVPDVTVAYPLLPLEAERVAAIIRNNQQVKVTVHVGSREHADVLAAAARRNGARVRYLVDLDVGCHRTGTSPTGAPELIRHLVETHAGALEFEGLHAYDGHNSHPSTSERDACAATAMEKVATCHAQLKGMGIAVRRVVAAGTPGFVPDLRELLSHRLEAEILVSPGTWIYWDTNYDEKMPGAFCLAAILYARVIDLPGSDLVTLNLGHKRWSIDQGPVHHFSVPGLEFVSATEEHTVLRCSGKRSLKYDDPVLIAPRHVCPTVNLWEHFILVGPDGQVENESLPVTARNR